MGEGDDHRAIPAPRVPAEDGPVAIHQLFLAPETLHLMLLLTRAEALAQARSDFMAYVDRALRAQIVDPAFASDLGRHWDRRLAALARIGSDFPVSEDVIAAMQVLSKSIRAELDPDAAVMWLDVYPDRIADLFPPSAVTFRLVDREEQEEAATLAWSSIIDAA
jgi:hypothetical protein